MRSKVATVAFALTAWGLISYVLTWALRSSGHETLVLVVGILQRFVPTVMIPGSGYFAYFCLGYFFRRFAPSTSGATRKKLIVIGLCAWVIDVACTYFGVDRFDPNFPWLFTTIAVLFLFDRIRITNVGAQRAFEWTGRRSYSIYLLQYTAIAIVAPFAYDTLLAGGIGGLIAPIRLLVWVGVVVGSYALSLAVASLVDATLLKLVQVGYDGVAKRVLRRIQLVR
ncbi:acyltransferase family protein [Enorma shizhengliae]|uniref:acyltransferase family protein n=1 Tax=Enorma shizhengliae TaxID=2606615 RepID=UPI0016432792|nr:acyltransferase family protein [Enorma shizhengliae]